MSRSAIQYLLRRHHISPLHGRGQHFLTDDSILERIVAAAQLDGTMPVLEVGAGVGNLTALLAQRSSRVVTFEVDTRFEPILSQLALVNKNVTVLYEDIRHIHFDVIRDALHLSDHGSYAIVANIPYYLTSHLIADIFRYPLQPDRIVILIQQEVAERIIAGPGSHSKLSLGVQFYGTPRIAFTVSSRCFEPAPEVDSALLIIEHCHPWSHDVPEKLVWQLIAFGFSTKRKKLANTLAAGLQCDRAEALSLLTACSIGENVRAQELSTEQWLALARNVRSRQASHP